MTMRSTIIIQARGAGYIADAYGPHSGGPRGMRAGLDAEAAALTAADLMLRYAQHNPAGGDLMAPAEVLALVPEHLRKIG